MYLRVDVAGSKLLNSSLLQDTRSTNVTIANTKTKNLNILFEYFLCIGTPNKIMGIKAYRQLVFLTLVFLF